MSSNNWDEFTLRINIRADRQVIYQAWATRAGMEGWFLRMSEYKDKHGNPRAAGELVEAGDSYKWLWYGWTDEVMETGEILAVDGQSHFRFSFGKAGICTVSIREELGEHLLELKQEDIPSDEDGRFHWHVGCKTGWTFYLANLKSVLEGGIDLRNRNPAIRGVLNS